MPPRRTRLAADPIREAARLWREHGWAESADGMAAITSLMRAQQIVLARVDATLKPFGVTFARYEALILLTFSRRGSLPLRVMGERLMVHPTSVTNTIDRLEEQGMVVRRPNPRDGRGTLAEITGLGREVAERATGDLMAARFGMGGYGTGELGHGFALLRGLRLAAGDFVPEPGQADEAAADVTGAAGGTGTAHDRDRAGAGSP